jgi:integration host factor subunit alpha
MTKKNFTRKDLSNSIFKELGFSKNFSSTIVDDFFEILIQHLVKFRKIKISSFGTFEVINKNERIGRNPKTKEEVKITSRKVVKFRPSSIFKKKINDNEKNI